MKNGSGMELWMDHNQKLTNANALLALNTERLKSQPADVITAYFLFLTWLNTQHGAVVIFCFFTFFLKSNDYCTEKNKQTNLYSNWQQITVCWLTVK